MPERAALVTGASSGIGLAIAEVLGETGHGLTVAARRPEKLAGAVEQLRGKGYEVEEVAANLTSEEDVQRVVAAHRERFGRLDVLVNSAGVGVGAAVADIQTKRVDMQLDLNLRAIVLFYRECADLLRAAGAEHRNALVVNLSSISGKSGPALAVGLLGHQGRGDRLDAGDEQGAQRRRDQVGGPVPGLRGHADDRVHPRAGQARGHDPDRRHRRRRCASCSTSPPPAWSRRSSSSGPVRRSDAQHRNQTLTPAFYLAVRLTMRW